MFFDIIKMKTKVNIYFSMRQIGLFQDDISVFNHLFPQLITSPGGFSPLFFFVISILM